MSLPTSFSFSPSGNLLASAGKDKVLNFYDMKKKSNIIHLKTVAVMDELEGVVILNVEHSNSILGLPVWTTNNNNNNNNNNNTKSSSKKASSKGGNAAHEEENGQPLVLVCAGEKGLLRLYKITYVKGSELSCIPLYQISLSSTSTSLLSSSSSSSSSTSSSTASSALLRSITCLHYVESSSELVAVTTDHNFCSYQVSKRSPHDDATTPVLRQARQLVGFNDDILDIAYVPRNKTKSVHEDNNNDDDKGDDERDTATSAQSFQLAVVTNSPSVRLMDQSFGFSLLDGHEDIVLAVDACPDG